MIALRFSLAVALGAFGAVAAGCSAAHYGPPYSAIGLTSQDVAAAKEQVTIVQFADLPKRGRGYLPTAITSGPDGSLWAVDTIDQDSGENAVVKIATSGKQEHKFDYGGLTSEGADFMGIATGPDGALWITDSYNYQILRMTTNGTYTGYALNGTTPLGIVSGPDNALWFTALNSSGSEIGRITTDFKTTYYPATGGALGITVGPDKALWFTEYYGNGIGRITTDGKVTEFTKGISGGAYPDSIAAGPDGALWFTEYQGDRIGRITTSGKVTEYSRGVLSGEHLAGIAAGPDGAMWFTGTRNYGSHSYSTARLGRITMSGNIVQFDKGLTASSDPTAIVLGPDRKLWFVESATDQIGRASL
jgi:streptogramin lyase